MLDEHEKHNIQRSWRLVEPIKETAADLFYRRLFELEPRYRALFPDDLGSQKRKLIKMLAFIVKSLDYPESAWRAETPEENDLFLVTLALGRRHRELYHVPDAAYATVGSALLWALDQGLGEAFTKDVHDAWAHVYQLLETIMRMGRGATKLGAPIVDSGSWD